MTTESVTYLTTDELSGRIKYDSRTIRERMLDSVLIEGVHYIRPFGGRKILFIWERIERDMALASTGSSFSGSDAEAEFPSNANEFVIPMASGGSCKVSSAERVQRQVSKASKHGGHLNG